MALSPSACIRPADGNQTGLRRDQPMIVDIVYVRPRRMPCPNVSPTNRWNPSQQPRRALGYVARRRTEFRYLLPTTWSGCICMRLEYTCSSGKHGILQTNLVESVSDGFSSRKERTHSPRAESSARIKSIPLQMQNGVHTMYVVEVYFIVSRENCKSSICWSIKAYVVASRPTPYGVSYL